MSLSWKFAIPLIAVTVATSLVAPAHAASSTYTNLVAEKCRLVDKAKEGEGEWARFRCPGHRGWTVHLDAGDLREWVRLRAPGAAAAVTIRGPVSAFNRIGPKLEWRSRSKGGQPFAVIYRITTTRNDKRLNRSYLYVAKLGPDGICLIAVVHRTAKPSKNIAARNMADNVAAGFNCQGGKPLIVR